MEFTSLVAVKSKTGELEALRHLERAEAHRVQPLVEVLSNVLASASVRELLGDVARALKQHERWLMLDASQLDRRSLLWQEPAGPLGYVWQVFQDSLELHELGEIPPFVPVVRLDDSDAHLRKTRGLLADLDRGVGLRIVRAGQPGLGMEAALERALRLLRTDVAKVDLIVDVGFLRDDRLSVGLLRAVLANLNSLPTTEFRSASLLGGSVPADRWDAEWTRPRAEFALWHQVLARFPRLRYADYGVTHALAQDRPEARRRRARHPYLHYTRCQGSRFLVRRLPPPGVAAEGDDELKQRYFADIAQDVIDSEAPRTRGWGNRMLRESAMHGGPADSSQWIAIGTSHHIAHLAAYGDLLPEDRL